MSKEFQNVSTIITDASCFILFDKLECLHLLGQLYQTVYTTPEIANEYGQQLPQFVIVQAVKNTDLLQTYAELVDIGEASAIALAGEVPEPILIIDDLKARSLASNLELEFTGSVGVLISARKNGLIQSLVPFFNGIKRTNFRVTENFLNVLLEKYDRS